MPKQKPETPSNPEPEIQSSAPLPLEAEVRAIDLEADTGATPSPGQDRETRIREAAYARSEQRGFIPGHEEEDWLEAERMIDEDRRGKPDPA